MQRRPTRGRSRTRDRAVLAHEVDGPAGVVGDERQSRRRRRRGRCRACSSAVITSWRRSWSSASIEAAVDRHREVVVGERVIDPLDGRVVAQEERLPARVGALAQRPRVAGRGRRPAGAPRRRAPRASRPSRADGSISIAPIQRSTSSSPSRLSRNRNVIWPRTLLGQRIERGMPQKTSTAPRACRPRFRRRGSRCSSTRGARRPRASSAHRAGATGGTPTSRRAPALRRARRSRSAGPRRCPRA